MKCKFKKSNGRKCRANAVNGSEFCWYHSPDISEQKKRAVSSKGGKGSSQIDDIELPEVTLKDVQDIPKLIIDAIQNVRKNQMEIRKGSVIGYLSNILLKAYEVADIDVRVQKIEQELEKLNPLNMF